MYLGVLLAYQSSCSLSVDVLYTASPVISYFIGSADSAMDIHLSVFNYRKLWKICTSYY